MKWKFDNDRAIYIQIAEQFKLMIISGQYKKGSKVAAVRELASESEVNPNTMQKALSELERQGLMYTSRTSGRYITDDEGIIVQTKNEFAEKKIKEFLEDMKTLGYARDDVVSLVEKYDMGGNKDE